MYVCVSVCVCLCVCVCVVKAVIYFQFLKFCLNVFCSASRT